MKLEVQNGEDTPVIYVISKSETYIGSRDTNDIIISSNEISAKHLKLIIVDDSCFVIDQGSTNGTYSNETQLVPGRRFELISFEPVRLGDKVFITLLEDKPKSKKTVQLKEPTEEPPVVSEPQKTEPSPPTEKTRVITLKELSLARKITAAKKREKLAVKKRIESQRIQKEKKALKRVTYIAIGWIVGGFLLQTAWRRLPSVMKKSYAPQKVYVDRVAMDENLEGQDQEFKISKDLIHSNEVLISYLNKKKCTSSIETIFCGKLPEYRTENNGVIELDGDLVFFMQKRQWFTKAEVALSAKGEEENVISDADVKKMAVIQLIEEGLGKSLPAHFPARNFYIVLYSNPNELAVVAVFKSSLLATISMKIYEIEHRSNEIDGSTLVKTLSTYIQFPYIDPY